MGTMFKNLILHDYQEKSFYHALRTKGFVILAGLSGTGKTKIFEEFCFNFDMFYKINKKYFRKLKNDSIQLLINYLENIISNENLDAWRHFSSILDTKAYRKDSKDLDDNIKILLDEINITKADLCLHYFTEGKLYKKRDSTEKYDVTVDENTARTKLKTDIIPILQAIKDRKEIADAVLQQAFSRKVKAFIWFLYHPEDYQNYSEIKDNVFEYLKREFSKDLTRKKLFLPVRPDFKDSKSLLGFYNPLKSEYQKSELLDFILEAQKEYVEWGVLAAPYLVLFDEMNLARVEYYFADFLSVLESKRVENESDVDDEMLKNVTDENNNPVSKDKLIGFYSKPIILHNENIPDIPQKLYLPPNLYFIGSVNIDETTYMFSPKVLDRAFTIEFDADMEMYIQRISKQNSDEPCCIENQEEKTEEISKETIKHEKERDVTEVGSSTKQDTSAEALNTNPSQDSSNPTDDNNPLCFELSDFIRWGKFAVIKKDCVRNIAKNGSLSYKVNNQQLKKSYKEILNEIFSILQPYGLHFGYRVFDEVMMFMCNATVDTNYKMDSTEALDLAIKMKILPKFHGTRQKLEDPIKKLITYCENVGFTGSLQNQPAYLSPKSIPILKEDLTKQTKYIVELDGSQHVFLFPHTARKLIEMLYKLQTQGFASFM